MMRLLMSYYGFNLNMKIVEGMNYVSIDYAGQHDGKEAWFYVKHARHEDMICAISLVDAEVCGTVRDLIKDDSFVKDLIRSRPDMTYKGLPNRLIRDIIAGRFQKLMQRYNKENQYQSGFENQTQKDEFIEAMIGRKKEKIEKPTDFDLFVKAVAPQEEYEHYMKQKEDSKKLLELYQREGMEGIKKYNAEMNEHFRKTPIFDQNKTT